MRRVLAWVVGALCVVGVTACGSDSTAPEMATPGDESVEAGFARDMSVHHAQAVAMAEIIRDRTTDPDLKLLASDIALGQQGQIGRMSGWLDEWGLNISSTNTPMAWMDAPTLGDSDMDGMGSMDMGDANAGSGHLDPVTGLMPGMATRPQVNALGTLAVDEAEISFLQLMIAHHRAGVEMAEAIVARTTHPSVTRLATAIVNAQTAEIKVMTDMLAKRGATP